MKVTACDNQYAISTAQLATGLSKTGAVAKTFGVSLEEVLGHITAIGSVTMETGDVIGNSLKTIYSRMTTHKEAKKALDSVGISLTKMTDEGEKAKGIGEIMGELAGKWRTLSDEQKQHIGVQIAGRNHLTRFLALMNNWKTATDATKTALNSQGSAAREQEAYMQSYEAKLNGIKTRFTELALAIGKAFLSDGMTSFLHGIASITEGVTKLISKIGVLPTIFSAISLVAGKMLFKGDFFESIAKGFGNIVDNIEGRGKKLEATLSKVGSVFSDFKSKFTSKLNIKGAGQELADVAKGSAEAGESIKKIGANSQASGTAMSAAFRSAAAGAKSFALGLASIALQTVALAAIGWAIGALIEKFTKASAEADRLKQKYAQQQETALEAYNKAGNTFGTSIQKFQELSKIPQAKMNTEQLEEYKNVQNEIAKVLPNAVAYTDQYGQAHLRSAQAVQKEVEVIQRLAQARAESAKTEFLTNLKKEQEGIDKLSKDVIEARKLQAANDTTNGKSFTQGFFSNDTLEKRYNEGVAKEQEALGALTSALQSNSVAIGDNAVEWLKASGAMANASTTASSVIQNYAKVNQATVDTIDQLADAENLDFGQAYVKSQTQLKENTEAFGKSVTQQYDKFKSLNKGAKEAVTKSFDTILRSMDLSKPMDEINTKMNVVSDALAKVGKNGEVNGKQLQKMLQDAGLSAREATEMVNELARATENDKLKLSIENGDIADTTESVRELTDELLKAVNALQIFNGMRDGEGEAVSSRIDYIKSRKKLNANSYLADDRVQGQLEQLSTITGVRKQTIVDNLEDIGDAFGKMSKLSQEEMEGFQQAFLEKGAKWDEMTKGMSEGAKTMFANMVQYVNRGGVTAAQALQLALNQVGQVSEQVETDLEKRFTSLKKNLGSASEAEFLSSWATTVQGGLKQLDGQFTTLVDSAGRLKLAMVNGETSPFIDNLNKQVEELGLTYQTKLNGGNLELNIVDANGNVRATLGQLNKDILESGMAAGLMEKAYRDVKGEITSVNTFLEQTGNILQASGQQFEVYEGGLRLVGETGATQKLALSEYNESLKALGLTIQSISEKDGKITVTLTDANGNTFTQTIGDLEQMKQKMDELNGKDAKAKVDVETDKAKQKLDEVKTDHQELDGQETKSEHTVDVHANDEQVQKTQEEIDNIGKDANVDVQVKANTDAISTALTALQTALTQSGLLQTALDAISSIIDSINTKTESLSSLQTTLDNIKKSAEDAKTAIDNIITAMTSEFTPTLNSTSFDNIKTAVEGVSTAVDTLQQKLSNLSVPSVLQSAPTQTPTAPTTDYTAMQTAQSQAISAMSSAWSSFASESVNTISNMALSINVSMVAMSAMMVASATVGTIAVSMAMANMGSTVVSSVNQMASSVVSRFSAMVSQVASLASSIGYRVAGGVNASAGAAAGAMASLAQGMINAFNARINSFDFAGAASRIARMIALGEVSSTIATDDLGIGDSNVAIEGLFNSSPEGLALGFAASDGLSSGGFGSDFGAGTFHRPMFTASAKDSKLADPYERKELDLTIERSQHLITRAKTVLEQMVKHTAEYRDQLMIVESVNKTLLKQEEEKLKTTLDRQNAIETELQGLKNVSSHTEKQREQYNKLQQEFDNNTKEIWKTEQTLDKLANEIANNSLKVYSDYLDEIKDKWNDVISATKQAIDALDFDLDKLDTEDDPDVVRKMTLQTRLREQTMILEKTYLNQLVAQQNEYSRAVANHLTSDEQLKKMKEEIIKTDENYKKEVIKGLKLEKEIRKEREEIAKENVDNLKSYYKHMSELSKQAIEKEKEALKKLQDEKNKMYDAEKEKINEVYNAKIESLDNTRKEEEYAKKINELNEKRADLMRKISLASRDDSVEGQKKVSDLQKELKKVNEDYDKEQKNKQDERYKDALKKQKELDEKNIEKNKKQDEELFDKATKDLENKAKSIDKYYDSITNDQKKWETLIKQFKNGDDTALDELMRDMVDGISNLMSGSGKDILGGEKLSPEDLKEILKDSLTDLSNVWYSVEKDMKKLTDTQNQALQLAKKNQDGLSVRNPQYTTSGARDSKNFPTTKQYKIAPGDPKPQSSGSGNPAGIKATHTVVRGDTLWDLAARYYGDPWKWKKIQAANGGINPYYIQIGQKLLIPFRSGGYTGDWAGDGGRIAMLHKKELVLNQNQTRDLLDTIRTLETIQKTNRSHNVDSHVENNGLNIENLEMHVHYDGKDDKSADKVAMEILQAINRKR